MLAPPVPQRRAERDGDAGVGGGRGKGACNFGVVWVLYRCQDLLSPMSPMRHNFNCQQEIPTSVCIHKLTQSRAATWSPTTARTQSRCYFWFMNSASPRCSISVSVRSSAPKTFKPPRNGDWRVRASGQVTYNMKSDSIRKPACDKRNYRTL
eukprot:1432501-Pyramimonas_sp.AAC.1